LFLVGRTPARTAGELRVLPAVLEAEDLAERDQFDAADHVIRRSALVVTRLKHAGFALGTRGAVLGWLGRHDEAIEVLQQAYVRNSSDAHRDLNACSLACSFAATGRTDETTGVSGIR